MPSLALDTPRLAETYDVVSDKQYEHGKLLLDALRILPGDRVLDIGCGTGRLGEYVAQTLVGPTGEVVGLDPLAHRIELARRRASPNHRAEVGVSDDLGRFAEASFDIAYLNSVYHWLPKKLPSLLQARRVLKPGGRIGISVASLERPHDQQVVLDETLRALGISRARGGSTPHKVTAGQLARQLEDGGFLVDEIRLRTFADVFPDTDAVLAFNESSSFGNFLSEYPPELRDRAVAAYRAALERRRTSHGIVLHRRLLFAVATAGIAGVAPEG
jgi:arsenite methyltransferase